MTFQYTILLTALVCLAGTVSAQINYEDYPHEYESIWSVETGFRSSATALMGAGSAGGDGVSFSINAPEAKVQPTIQVTSAGTVLMYKDNRIAGYDPADGKSIFDSNTRKEGLPSINTESISEVPNSPFIALSDLANRTNEYLVNVIDGSIIANTDEAGLNRVFDRFILPESASALYVGRKGVKSVVALYDLETGNGWVQEKLFRFKGIEHRITGNPLELGNGSFAVPTDNGLFCIDIATGESRWRNYIPFANMETGSSMFEDKEQSGGGIFGAFNKPKEEEEKGFLGAEEVELIPAQLFRMTDKPYVFLINQNGLMAYDINTGDEVWKRHRSADPEITPILIEAGIIIFDKEIFLYDYDTGEATWGSNKKWTSDFSKDNNKFDGSLDFFEFVPQGIAIGVKKMNRLDQARYELNVLDLSTGKLKFKEGFETDGVLLEMWSCGAGVFYTTDRAAGVWNATTGQDAFPPIAATTKNTFFMTGSRQPGFVAPANGKLLTAFNGHIAYLYNTETNHLFKIDTEKGVKTQITKTPFIFQETTTAMLTKREKTDDRDPNFIEIREQGIYLSSPQSMAMLDFDGNLIYQVYHEAPGYSIFSKIMATAAAVYENYRQQNDAPRPEPLPIGLLKASNASTWNKTKAVLANTALRVEVNMNAVKDVMHGRFEKSQRTSDHYFINTQLSNKREDGSNTFGLLKIHKDTGEIEKVFPFGKNRNPQFTIDELSERLFYFEEEDSGGFTGPGGALRCIQL